MPKHITEEYLERTLDDRFEAFGREVKAGFDAVDDRFLKVDERFLGVEDQLRGVRTELDAIQRLLKDGFGTLEGFVTHLTRNDQEIAMNHGGLLRHEERITALEQKTS